MKTTNNDDADDNWWWWGGVGGEKKIANEREKGMSKSVLIIYCV